MKRFIGVLICTVLLVSLVCTSALANTNGIVLANSISVRVSPDETSQKLFSAKNSRDLVITGQTGEWYIVDLRASGFDADGSGYVKSRYVVTNGYKIQLSGGTVEFYTDPWSGLCNGSRNSGIYLVTYETSDWLVIQINETVPGSAFIRKADVGLYNTEIPINTNTGWTGYVTAPGGTNSKWYVMYDSDGVSVGIRVEPDLDTEKLAIIHSGDIVTVLDNRGEFAYVVYEKPNGQLVYGWVRTKYFLPVNE